jgi:ABC-2 type transport system permease protein
MLVQSLSKGSNTVSNIADEIRTGQIAYIISKPYSYILYHYCRYLGSVLSKIQISLPLGIIAALILVGVVPLNILGILSGMLLLFFGYTLNFLINVLIGLTAFLIEDPSPFNWIYNKSQFILGGMILPLSMLPDSLQHIVMYLPFSQLFYSSSRMIVNFNFLLFQQYLFTQLIWIIVLIFLSWFFFHKSVKFITLNGG